MKIRKINEYSAKLYKAVLRLLPLLDKDASLPDKEYFKAFLADTNTHFFIVELENGDIAGMFTLATCKIPTGEKFWIEDLVVDDTQRGKGLGKEMVQFAIEYARSLGAINIRLTSRPERIEANKLYPKMGFVKYETNIYKYTME
jgi:GNAT superfamily N-acetyltransferase